MDKLRVVIDTNTIASAIINPKGNPAKVLDAWKGDWIEVIASMPILDELRRVLSYEKIRKRSFYTDEQIDELIRSYAAAAIMTPGTLQLHVIDDDPTDNQWLMAAIEGQADYIVSGDAHLLDLKIYQSIPIVSPTQFVVMIENWLKDLIRGHEQQ